VDGACCPQSRRRREARRRRLPSGCGWHRGRHRAAHMDGSTPLLSTMGTPCDEGWKAQGVAVLCLCALSFMACAPVELPGALAGTHNDSISQGRTQVYADRPFCAAVGGGLLQPGGLQTCSRLCMYRQESSCKKSGELICALGGANTHANMWVCCVLAR